MRVVKFTIPLQPVTKKNSQQIKWKWAKDKKTGKAKQVPYIRPSEAYERYEDEAGWFITGKLRNMNISAPVNVQCTYYMATQRKVDLPNLINATMDVLVKYRVISDDNRDIVYSTDGSRVLCDRKNPRVEITITEAEGDAEVWGAR